MSYIPSPQNSFSLPGDSYSFSSHICPSYINSDGSLKDKNRLEVETLSWIREAIEEGSSYLKQCRAYENLPNAIDLITEQVQKDLPSSISQIYVPSIKRNIKEMAAILSNIRPSWLYEARSTNDEEWLLQARIQNGLSADWYKRNFVDRKLKSLLQLGLVEATGYISPIWNPHYHRYGIGDIELKLYRYDEVLNVQLPRDFNFQNAYATILIDEMGINRARTVFQGTGKANKLIPDRTESRSLLKGAIQSAMDFFGIIREADSQPRKSSGAAVDILYIYIDDNTINSSKTSSIQMGPKGASWAYEVPYLGQQIFDGYDSKGDVKTRKATREDCFLFPNKRLIIASRTAVLHDGPSYWWHGKTPLIKYSPDDWIFSYLGFSLAAEVKSMQTSAIKMRRSLEDALHLTIDPPLEVDEHISAKKTASSTSIRTPGKRIRTKMAMGQMVRPVLDPSFYKPGPEHFKMVDEVEQKMKEILGLPDLQALQKASQVPSSDSIEKFFSEAGAIVTDMSRSMDKPLYELADMNRYYFYQFYTLTDRIKILGEDGITQKDFDFNPGTLIPASLPNEPELIKGEFRSTSIERAKKHINNFRTTISPTSLHQITHMQKKLLYMQATKLNPLLVDPETLANMLDIQNWGHLEGDTVLEKVQSALKIQESFGLQSQFKQGLLQLMLQMMAQQQSPEGQLTGAIGELANELKSSMASNGGGGNPLLKNPVGRPPDFDDAPELKNIPGQRTTITT